MSTELANDDVYSKKIVMTMTSETEVRGVHKRRHLVFMNDISRANTPTMHHL